MAEAIKENTENQEEVLQVFTEEELSVLPQETQDVVVYLTDKLPATQLKVLNPVVAKLLEIKKLDSIVYDKEKPETIQEYKDAVKEIGAFNTMTKNAKTAIKKPLDELGKKVLLIEKALLKVSDDTKDSLQKTFKEYIDDQAKIIADKAAKKAKETTDKIESLESANTEALGTIAKTNTLNFIKYDIAEKIEKRVNECLPTYTLVALKTLRQGLFPDNYLDLTIRANNVKSDEDIEAGTYTKEEYDTAVAVLEARLKTIKLLLDNKITLLENNVEDKPADADSAEQQNVHPATTAAQAFMGYGGGGGSIGRPIESQVDSQEEEPGVANESQQAIDRVIGNPLTPEEYIADMEAVLRSKITLAEKIYAQAEQSPSRKRMDGTRILLTKVLTYLTKPIE